MNPFDNVPNEKNTGINRSFRDIAKELTKFKKILLADPVTKEFLKSSYSKTREQVEFLDRVWTAFANKLVNDTSNVPKGYGKRILFCTNGGKVFIDVSTYVKDSPKWLNYSMIFADLQRDIQTVESQSHTVSSDILLPAESITFNPHELRFDNFNDATKIETTSLRAGSIEAPRNTTAERTKPVRFQVLENHSTRKEIIMTFINEYGWASRYSDTIFAPNWYVATQIRGKDGYSVFLRLSYFKL
jgi:hypothetical protein